MINVFIYTLTNPIDQKVFYVGRATNLKARLSGHIADANSFKSRKNEIIKSIVSKNLIPIIEEIDRVECCKSSDELFANKIEEYWINQLTAWGFNITNVVGVKRNYKESLKIYWHRHDKEYDRLINEKYSIKIKIEHWRERVMPEQMNTPLGRRVWKHDRKIELDALLSKLSIVNEKIQEKYAIYYNN